jgi:tetratricopeptide (TPR) repeat protein
MIEELAEAKRLRVQARERLAAQELEAALGALDAAIATLEPLVARDKSEELYRDLAETYGMRGGVLRRMRRTREAVASYERGRDYEQDDDYGTDDSYNLVNAIVLPLYDDPTLLDRDGFEKDLADTVRVLKRQIRGTRGDDFWAQADLARCLLLSNKLDEAKPCLDRFVQLGGLKDGYASTLQVLRELEQVLAAANRPEADLFDKSVAYLREAVEHGSRLDRPTCFVLMPFGKKPSTRGDIDFDAIYKGIIEPAIDEAGLEPVRADAEVGGGVIHKAMFERLLISEFAVADLTLNNPNVFYELGVRHGNRGRVTVLMSAEDSAPFDVALLRTLKYRVGSGGVPADDESARIRSALAAKLKEARQGSVTAGATDNPIAALLQDFKSFDIPSRLKADVFRDKADYALDIKRRLAEARALPAEQALPKLEEIEEAIQPEARETEPGASIDLLLSYRGIGAWKEMLALVARLPKVVRDTEFVREQQALALNRRNKGADRYLAVEMLEALIAERGPSSEAFALIGRIYKDMWDELRGKEPLRARGVLKKAIDAYREGFDADLRDAFPGINLLTLLEIQGSKAGLEEQARKLPIVRHATELRLRNKPDYWDHVTMLELGTLARDDEQITQSLENAAAAAAIEPFQLKTTARNLKLIVEARAARTPPEAPSSALVDAIKALEQQSESA